MWCDRVLYRIFFGQGGIRFYVFLNMYSLLCFPLVLLLSYTWQWFSKCKSETVFVYILMFSVHVVIKFQGGICQGGYPGFPPLYESLGVMWCY